MEVCSVCVSLELHQHGDPQTTAALLSSKFFQGVEILGFELLAPIPVNLATPSPNGQWMAIRSDMPEHVLMLSAVSTVQARSGIATQLVWLCVPEDCIKPCRITRSLLFSLASHLNLLNCFLARATLTTPGVPAGMPQEPLWL